MKAAHSSREHAGAAATPATGWRTTLRLIGADRFVQTSLVVCGLALVWGATTSEGAAGVVGGVGQLGDSVVLALTLAALFWSRVRTEGRERRFWGLLALAWACWLAIDGVYFFGDWMPAFSAVFVTDSLYIIFYLIFALALDLRPHLRADPSLTVTRRRLESAAALLSIFGLLFYFGIVMLPEPLGFSLSFVPRDRGLTTLLLVRLSLDLFLLGRLLFAAFGARPRWSRLYLLLASGFLFYLVRDSVSLLQYEQLIALDTQNSLYSAFLFLPGFLVLVAARYRHLPFPEDGTMVAVDPTGETEEALRPSPVALYALLVPAVHFVLFPLGLLEAESRAPREVFSLIYVLVLGAMAWFHQRVVAQDTRRYRLALGAAEERLARSQRLEAVGRLAGGIAHDFNNYLTVISGYGELLKNRLQDEQAKNDLGHIEDAADKAAHLTSQLLAFGRRQVLRPEALDLNRVVGQTARLLHSLLGEDVRLELDLDPVAAWAEADLGQLEQVLVNLAINGRDAMPRGGTLSIKTRRTVVGEAEAQDLEIEPGSYIALFVADNGKGMSEEVKARVFEPFFTTKEGTQGTGLGMATVFGVVSQSDGAVSIETALGVGTTVRVLLPTVVPPETEPAAPPAVDHEPEKAALLVVEDEGAVRRLASRTLTNQGFDVVEAASGQEALDRLASHGDVVDMLITDVKMPGMDGTELATRLKARWPDLRVLFISGYPTETLRERQAELPAAVALLQKPFTPTELLAAVRQVLEQPLAPTDTGLPALLDLEKP